MNKLPLTEFMESEIEVSKVILFIAEIFFKKNLQILPDNLSNLILSQSQYAVVIQTDSLHAILAIWAIAEKAPVSASCAP